MLGGSDAEVDHLEAAVRRAAGTGYPVMLKAAGGGGGKGMRVVEDETSLRRIFDLCRAEAGAAFGTDRVFVERFLRTPRHVEVQVAGDGQGHAIYLGTRDCSLQRRHQKIVEEGPAPNLPEELHLEIQRAAARLVASVRYRTVATVEFLVDEGRFYFLEVNPRIQVEHPVTEQITGVDLVSEQIRLTAGEGLSLRQDDVVVRGHAIEIRVNAEDPWSFLPSPGRITGWHAPGGLGIRIDSAAHEGAFVPPYYDSLVAKLIVHGRDREHAIRKVRWAMDEFVVEGIKTTLPLQKELVSSPVFRDVGYHTRWVDHFVADRVREP